MIKILIVTETKLTPKMEYLFWTILHDTGLHKQDCLLIALLGDEKPDGSYQKASAAQLSRLMPAFRERLSRVTASIVIPCGGPVFRLVSGLTWNIDSSRAYVIPVEWARPANGRARVQIGAYKRDNQAKGITAGDPKFAIRQVPLPPALPFGCTAIVPSITIESVVKMRMKTLTAFKAAYRNATRYSSGEPLVELGDYSTMAPAPGLDWQGTVAYDLEVPFDSNAIERASLASKSGCWSFPWDGDGVRAMTEALDGATTRVAHNQQFDIPVLAAHGISVPEPTYDTMLAASLIEPDLPKSLAAVTPLYVLTTPWKHLSDERGFADPEYSAKDALMERELGIRLEKEIDSLGMTDLFSTMMSAVPVLIDMKQQGIKVDREAVGRWCAQLQADLDLDLRTWGQSHSTVNPFSPAQLKGLLYNEWGLSIKRRKGDGISTDELALVQLKEEAPSRRVELDLLLRLREKKKLLGTYGRTALGVDRVHPSYLPVGKDGTMRDGTKGLAATGRLATSNPNIQNQPKEARVIYVPDSPSMCFVEFDWSQAELRVAAALSGDRQLQKALDGDIHDTTQRLLGCDRTRAKNVLYGSAYGAGPKKLRETLQATGIVVTEAECRKLQENLAQAYPTWWAWRWSVAEQAANQQYLRNPFGRLRRFPLGREAAPAALDFLPQSTVADMAWSLYRQLWEQARRMGGRLTTVVHDSFLFQLLTPDGCDIEALEETLQSCFPEIAQHFYIPVTVKVGGPGESWGHIIERQHASV